MKTDSKIAILISSLLMAFAVYLFLWGLPYVFNILSLREKPFSENDINYQKKAVSYSIFREQKIYNTESLIVALYVREQYDETIKYYENIEKNLRDFNNPDTKILKSTAARAYIKTGQYEKALQLAKDANKLYLKAQIYIATNDLSNAKNTVEKIFSTKTTSKVPYLYVAQIQLKEGHPKSALQSIDKLLKVAPQNHEAIEVKAQIYESLGQKADAEKYYLRAKQIKDERRNKLGITY